MKFVRIKTDKPKLRQAHIAPLGTGHTLCGARVKKKLWDTVERPADAAEICHWCQESADDLVLGLALSADRTVNIVSSEST